MEGEGEGSAVMATGGFECEATRLGGMLEVVRRCERLWKRKAMKRRKVRDEEQEGNLSSRRFTL